MTKEQIRNANKLIAKFMGDYIDDDCVEWWRYVEDHVYTQDTGTYYLEAGCGHFHLCWSWLMSVVDKIDMLPNVLDFSIGTSFVQIEMNDESTFGYTIFAGEKKIEVTYKTIIKFIKHYNKLNNE